MYEYEIMRRMRIIYSIAILVIISLGVCAFIIRGVHKDRTEDTEQTEVIPEVATEVNDEPIEEIRVDPEQVQNLTPDSMNNVEEEVVAEIENVAEPLMAIGVNEKSEPKPIDISFDDDVVNYLAKTVWGEARGCSTIEQAAVIWCILNRVDSELSYMPDDIISVITQRDGEGYYHFRGYDASFPVEDDIYELVVDVLSRWELEKTGVEDVGRVLPKEYLYFHGDGEHNHFRDKYSGGNRWDWSLPNPYEE